MLLDNFDDYSTTLNQFYFLSDQYTNADAWIGRTRRDSTSNTENLMETVNGVPNGFMRFKHHRLDSFSSFPTRFGGAEIKSRNRWYPTKTSTSQTVLEYVARLRVPKVSNLFPAGLVAAFFSYGGSQTAKDDEIDFEFLGTRLTEPVAPKRLWLNMWRGSTQNPLSPDVPAGVDVSQWQTYKISWSVDRIVWQVQVGSTWQTLRIANRGEVGYPFNAQHVHFNIWAPYNSANASAFAPSGGQFDEAANMSYTPTTNPAQDIVHYFDVDQVAVTEYTKPVAAASASPDGGAPTQEPAPVSSVSLSSVQADSARPSVRLIFTGALDAKEASNAQHYVVTLNGATRPALSAEYDAASSSVLLVLPSGSLTGGGKVRVDAFDLRDAKGLKLVDQFGQPVAAVAAS